MPTSSISLPPVLAGWKLIAALVLFAAELWVMFLALHPRVDEEYAAHFLDRRASCWVRRADREGIWAGGIPRTIEVRNLRYPQSCQVLRRGWWGKVQDWGGVWSGGKYAGLEVPITPGVREVVLSVIAPPILPEGQEVEAFVNERALGRFVIPAGRVTELRLPVHSAPEQGWAPYRIEFLVQKPISRAELLGRQYQYDPDDPDAKDDWRRLGIGLLRIETR